MAEPRERSRWTVEVTPEDIENAHENDSYRCVVARAISRTIPEASRIEVDIQTIRFTREGKRYIYMTPYSVAGYIIAFDAGEELEPFSFQLRNPQIKPVRKRTEAGQQVNQAQNRVRDAKNEAKKAKRTLRDPEASAADKAAAEVIVQEAPEQIAAATKERDDLRAAYRASQTQLTSEPGRRPPPRIHKTKKRSYGNRILRVNQEEGRVHYAGTK